MAQPKVLIHHEGLDRTVEVPASSAKALADSGWEIVERPPEEGTVGDLPDLVNFADTADSAGTDWSHPDPAGDGTTTSEED